MLVKYTHYNTIKTFPIKYRHCNSRSYKAGHPTQFFFYVRPWSSQFISKSEVNLKQYPPKIVALIVED